MSLTGLCLAQESYNLSSRISQEKSCQVPLPLCPYGPAASLATSSFLLRNNHVESQEAKQTLAGFSPSFLGLKWH